MFNIKLTLFLAFLCGNPGFLPAVPGASGDSDIRARAIESGLTFQEFSQFQIRFDGSGNRDKAWQAVSYLNEAYREMGSAFGEFPAGKMEVIIFSSQDFKDAWQGPRWRAGFFSPIDGKIRVKIDNAEIQESEFRSVTRHEFAHAFEFRLYPHRMPRWFEEGTAEFYAYYNPSDGFWKDQKLDALQKELRRSPWLTMGNLEAIFSALTKASNSDVYHAYRQAQAFILQVSKDRGDSWIPGVISRLQTGSTFDEAFQTVVGISPEESMARVGHAWE